MLSPLWQAVKGVLCSLPQLVKCAVALKLAVLEILFEAQGTNFAWKVPSTLPPWIFAVSSVVAVQGQNQQWVCRLCRNPQIPDLFPQTPKAAGPASKEKKGTFGLSLLAWNTAHCFGCRNVTVKVCEMN